MPLPVYRDASEVDLILPFENNEGDAVVPASATWRVYDQDNTEIIADTTIDVSGSPTHAEFTVPVVNNTLGAGEVRLLRVVELKFTDTEGITYETLYTYVVEDKILLQVAVNSCQTFGQAFLHAQDMSNLNSWNAASDDDKRRALVEAYERLMRLHYTYPFANVSSWEESDYLSAKTDYPKFWRALTKAQVAEADVILGNDFIAEQRSAGLLSESVGESTQFYRSRKPINHGISRNAYRYISVYVSNSIQLSRA